METDYHITLVRDSALARKWQTVPFSRQDAGVGRILTKEKASEIKGLAPDKVRTRGSITSMAAPHGNVFNKLPDPER